MEKHYRICDLNVLMDSFGTTEQRAEKYRCEPFEQADILVISHAAERKKRYPHLSYDDCEYLSTGAYFYSRLLSKNGIKIHSSAVVVDNRAYLFTANSGTGKSTHTSLWLELFGDRAYILNDDKPALRFIDGVWYAYGTPWSGKNDISVNTRVPVAGVAVLERGERNEIAPFNGVDAIMALLGQTSRPRRADFCTNLMNNLNSLITHVPIWKLKCNMDPEAAIVSYEAMSGNKFKKEK